MNKIRAGVATTLIVAILLPQCTWAFSEILLLEYAPLLADEMAPLRGRLIQDLRSRLGSGQGVLGEAETEAVWQGVFKEVLGAQPLPYESREPYLDDLGIRLILARRAYFQFRFVECLERLQSFDAIRLRLPDEVRRMGKSAFHRALLEGVCWLAQSKRDEARAGFRQAARLAPDEILDPRAYSPEVIDLFEEVKEEARGHEPSVSLSLRSEPPFMGVYLNGEFLGETPFYLAKIPLGAHLLEIRGRGYVSYWRHFVAETGKNIEIAATLKPEILQPGEREKYPFGFLSSASPGEPLFQENLATVAEAAGVEGIGLVAVSPRMEGVSVELILFDRQTQEMKTHSISYLQTAPESWANLLGDLESRLTLSPIPPRESVPLVVAPSSIPDIRPESVARAHLVEDSAPLRAPAAREVAQEEPAWYRKWWVWTVIAVVVAGAAAGTAIALNDGNSPSGSSQGGATFTTNPATGRPAVVVGSHR